MIGNHIFLILNWSREKIQEGKNVADKTQSMRKSKGYEKDKKKKKEVPLHEPISLSFLKTSNA